MNVIPLTAKDFTSDQEVRWCPGCGDYAILKSVRTALAQIGRQPHDVVSVGNVAPRASPIHRELRFSTITAARGGGDGGKTRNPT